MIGASVLVIPGEVQVGEIDLHVDHGEVCIWRVELTNLHTNVFSKGEHSETYGRYMKIGLRKNGDRTTDLDPSRRGQPTILLFPLPKVGAYWSPVVELSGYRLMVVAYRVQQPVPVWPVREQ